ncbi:transcription repressor NadR [Fictibacillus gelatini]|uniref:transcription repressor NadR n=1 Tax=Fictibacillus gelatini TaxID=225985 RepID=UPI0004286F92|nr:transcription repressor NadR [Fictibacillus gelatini]
MKEEKILGEDRRSLLLKWLKESDKPLKGSELASKTNVSRQVIVQDISLLKAKKEPIIATSQGYVYIKNEPKDKPYIQVIASIHTPGQTKDELFTIVDHGVTVKDVMVEHPIYGDLTASLMLSNRKEVEDFMERLKETNAVLLSALTEGIHLHTLEAPSKKQLDAACEALRVKGYLFEQS